MSESWMMMRLRRETAVHHQVAGADRRELLDHRDAVRRAQGLARIYGFEAPLESAFAMTAELDAVIDLRDRDHVRCLRADLVALGVDIATIPRCPSVFPFRHPREALGWLYAVDCARAPACELGAAMDALAKSLGAADQIVAAARAAFRAQHSWYETPRPRAFATGPGSSST
jgi:heme oxygenase